MADEATTRSDTSTMITRIVKLSEELANNRIGAIKRRTVGQCGSCEAMPCSVSRDFR